MQSNLNKLKKQYDDKGYFVIRNYFNSDEIKNLRYVILKFHELWKKDNKTFYREEAFNSSLITGSQYLAAGDRVKLFNFISSPKMMTIVECLIPTNPAFMNTQLFFNPVNPKQKDFWHRDCQYDHDIEGQKLAIQNTQVVHLRVPLFDELGMELIPETHKRWDNDEEFNVRQEEQGKLIVLLQDAIEAVSKREKYDLVVTKQAVLFAKPGLDISDKVIQELSK